MYALAHMQTHTSFYFLLLPSSVAKVTIIGKRNPRQSRDSDITNHRERALNIPILHMHLGIKSSSHTSLLLSLVFMQDKITECNEELLSM